MSIMTNLFAGGKVATLLRGYRPEFEPDFDFSNSDLPKQEEYFDVFSKKELPVVGSSAVTYRTLCDMELWSWTNGAYTTYNPYSFGITHQYNEVKREVVKPMVGVVIDDNHNRLVLQDERQLPSISIDDVRNGSDPRMAILYNLEALREDLRTITDLKITFDSMVSTNKDRPYFRNLPKQNVLDNWFLQNHSALHLLLRSACRTDRVMDKTIIDCINTKGAHLWWDEKACNAKFKDGEFEVNL